MSAMDDDLRILRTPEVSSLTGLSVSTLEKLRLTGNGPPFIQLTARLVGYRMEDLRAWIAARPVHTSTSGRAP